MSVHKWQFPSRFRRNTFGWRSQVPMQRIKEALSEIRLVVRYDSVLAAEGAVLFLEKIAPALEQVDSSSGAIGNAVNNAIEVLVPIISKAPVSDKERQKWLERLWEALNNDHMPYIENLGEYWGEICATQVLASAWADEFITMVKHIWSPNVTGSNYYKGTIPCLSALYAAKRYQELLELLEHSPLKWWYEKRWGVKALVALGKPDEALTYAKNFKGLNDPITQISCECETILLSMGLSDEAYERYALEVNQKGTNSATFRAIVKKYPKKAPIDILHNLIASQPGKEGKWFAAAKNAGFYDLAMQLISKYPTDPRTLSRATKDFSEKNTVFAIACGMASLHWILEGYGYNISNFDVLAAYSSIVQAANAAGISHEINEKIRELLSYETPSSQFVRNILMHHLKGCEK